jgi:hypothetical protein
VRRPLESQPPSAEQMQQKYLRAINARLWLLPASKRTEIREELAAHIHLLILEQRHQGCPALDATQVALQQFGDPASVGRLLAWQWSRENLIMNRKTFTIAGLLLVPAMAFVPVGILLQRPALAIQKVQILPLSPVEKRDYKGADMKVVIEVKDTPSIIQRPFAQDTYEGANYTTSYLVDSMGRKYQWDNVFTCFARRGKNMLLSYPIPLSQVPPSGGKVTFVSRFSKGREWQALPISVIVRP